jgi:hypothetical protein
MGLLYSENGRALTCDKCGTNDFSVEGRPFDFALICPDCVLIMCSACFGRDYSGEIGFFCCYNCRSSGLREAEKWADRLAWSPRGADPSSTR